MKHTIIVIAFLFLTVFGCKKESPTSSGSDSRLVGKPDSVSVIIIYDQKPSENAAYDTTYGDSASIEWENNEIKVKNGSKATIKVVLGAEIIASYDCNVTLSIGSGYVSESAFLLRFLGPRCDTTWILSRYGYEDSTGFIGRAGGHSRLMANSSFSNFRGPFGTCTYNTIGICPVSGTTNLWRFLRRLIF